MTDFLSNLADRARGVADVLRPVHPLYRESAPVADAPLEVESEREIPRNHAPNSERPLRAEPTTLPTPMRSEPNSAPISAPRTATRFESPADPNPTSDLEATGNAPLPRLDEPFRLGAGKPLFEGCDSGPIPISKVQTSAPAIPVPASPRTVPDVVDGPHTVSEPGTPDDNAPRSKPDAVKAAFDSIRVDGTISAAVRANVPEPVLASAESERVEPNRVPMPHRESASPAAIARNSAMAASEPLVGSEESRHVTVTIGRLEVRVASSQPTRVKPAAEARKEMTLQDYLRRVSEGGAG